MIQAYYNDIPDTIQGGTARRGEYVVFVTGGLRDLTETEKEEHVDSQYISFSERVVLKEFTAEKLVEALSNEMILALNEKDCENLMTKFANNAESWRALRKRQVEAWDCSSHVNSFEYDGEDMWFSQSTRNSLIMRFEAEAKVGSTTTVAWHNSRRLALPLDDALQLVYTLEVYASQCYDTTAAHLAELEMLETVEKLKAFDYTSDYPKKLVFRSR